MARKNLEKILLHMLHDLYELWLEFTECPFKNNPTRIKIILLISIHSGLSLVRARFVIGLNNFV